MPVWLEIVLACLTFLSTMILLGITWKYVRLTKQILKATNNPQILMFLRKREQSIYLCIQNVGTGYAMDVRFIGNLSFKPLSFKPEGGDLELKDIEPYKNGLDYLGSGQKFETLLFPDPNSSYEKILDAIAVRTKKPLEITAIYEDSTRTSYETHFKLDFSKWEDDQHFVTLTNDVSEVAEVLENINNTLRGQSNTVVN